MKLTNILFSSAKKWSTQYSNLPDRYIKRAMEQVHWRNPKGVQYKPNAVVQRKKFHFSIHRPWTLQFKQENTPGTQHKKVWLEPIAEWSHFRGDRVEVLVGKDKGKQGIIKEIIQERNWVIVEGLNCKLQQMGNDEEYEGVYVKTEKPLLVTSEVALVDPSDLAPTTIEWRFTEEGNRIRVSTRTGRVIPMPPSMEETYDFKNKASYKEQPKDTTAKDASEITFEPMLKTFEMDIMEKMGIKEDRVPVKSYWY